MSRIVELYQRIKTKASPVIATVASKASKAWASAKPHIQRLGRRISAGVKAFIAAE